MNLLPYFYFTVFVYGNPPGHVLGQGTGGKCGQIKTLHRISTLPILIIYICKHLDPDNIYMLTFR